MIAWDFLMIWSSFTDSLTWFTWQDGPLFCGWDGQPLRVPPEEYGKRILQTRQSMQEVSLKRFTFLVGKCLELREGTKYRETWSVLLCFFRFISVLRAFGGSRMASTSSLWCSLRSVQEIGKSDASVTWKTQLSWSFSLTDLSGQFLTTKSRRLVTPNGP